MICLINHSVHDTTAQLCALTTQIMHVYGKIIKQIPLSRLYCGSWICSSYYWNVWTFL